MKYICGCLILEGRPSLTYGQAQGSGVVNKGCNWSSFGRLGGPPVEEGHSYLRTRCLPGASVLVEALVLKTK